MMKIFKNIKIIKLNQTIIKKISWNSLSNKITKLNNKIIK